MAQTPPFIKLALPKGRMEKGVLDLLAGAGVQLTASSRQYRPLLSLTEFETKILKPQNIVEMLHLGSCDIGFAGADWVAELKADLVELLDTSLDPVRLVAAAPESLLEDGRLPNRALVVATEYPNLTEQWILRHEISARVVRSYGATEVFPPEDADCIVDNSASGLTLKANQLVIVDQLMTSSTRLYANPKTLECHEKREGIERLVLILESVLEARKRVMLEVNVGAAQLESVISILPCMRTPTIAPLYKDNAYAVRAAVPRSSLPNLIPAIKASGGTDIVVSSLSQITP